MQCPYCSANIKDGSTVCTKCGEILTGGASGTKKYDIESELKNVASKVADLPDDSEILEKKKNKQKKKEKRIKFKKKKKENT